MSHKVAADMCRCVVPAANVRGADRNLGAYDADKLQPIIESCVRTELVQ